MKFFVLLTLMSSSFAHAYFYYENSTSLYVTNEITVTLYCDEVESPAYGAGCFDVNATQLTVKVETVNTIKTKSNYDLRNMALGKLCLSSILVREGISYTVQTGKSQCQQRQQNQNDPTPEPKRSSIDMRLNRKFSECINQSSLAEAIKEHVPSVSNCRISTFESTNYLPN